ncbi:MAG: F0F1 ATP synthase subunit gamma [Sphingomonadales bacterium]|nr:F0F1 ATP synthase subunit gamma [Sphingomonadales bacterium]
MPSLKDLKTRISSVTSTQKITKAMKMVAASKLRRAQEAAVSARPYAERMDRVMAGLGASLATQNDASPLLVGTGKDDVHLVVVASSERGLCGGFNTSIVRGAKAKINRLVLEGKTVKILCIGKKGFQQLKRDYEDKIIDVVDITHIRRMAYSDAQPIGQRLLDMFAAGEFDVCSIFYSEFKSALTQIVTDQQLIPAKIPETDDVSDGPDLGGAIYSYEPGEEEILDTLLPRNISVQVFRALLENAASEQGSRMTAMDSATRNAGDMIKSLTVQYNRSRQAVITKELIEIISGAEAV